MSYTIQLTNGTTLTQIVDTTIDQTSTSLALVGKNATGYGAFLNDNFVHLLENFAYTNAPSKPITGQLWFDTTQNRLKVYNGTAFNVTGGALVGAKVPSGITTGDTWIDSGNSQFYFNDGVSNILAGPIYNSTQGLSGFQIQDVVDVNKQSHTIASLYVSKTLIGIFSASEFTPASSITGFTGNVGVGFNAGNLSGFIFKAPASSANALIAPDGTSKTTSNFLSTTDNSATQGTLSIQNTMPLILGTSGQTEINVNDTIFQIASNKSNQDFAISTLVGSTLTPGALYIRSSSQSVGIFNNNPQYNLDVTGTFRTTGAATIGGMFSIKNAAPPATSSSTGTAGQIAWGSTDASTYYVYVCIATNTWRRALLSAGW